MFTLVVLVLTMLVALKTNVSPFTHLKVTLAARNVVLLGACSSLVDQGKMRGKNKSLRPKGTIKIHLLSGKDKTKVKSCTGHFSGFLFLYV